MIIVSVFFAGPECGVEDALCSFPNFNVGGLDGTDGVKRAWRNQHVGMWGPEVSSLGGGSFAYLSIFKLLNMLAKRVYRYGLKTLGQTFVAIASSAQALVGRQLPNRRAAPIHVLVWCWMTKPNM